jgi:hypothetical protein
MTTQQDVLVARRMLRDIVECAEHDSISRALGFVPASPDVDETEHMASHERLEATEPLTPEIIGSADIAAEVLLKLGSMSWPSQPSHDDRMQARAMCRAACIAVIAHLVDTRFLEVAR